MENIFPEEPTASDVFWSRIGDWLAVRGAYAPKGVTREFAVVTCWLIRIGAVVLVGAMAYFLMMVIDEGWIGPVQRVYGMMAGGMVGIAGGTWIKLKMERYAVLGEVCTALGTVALYLSFGLGHRLYDPPVIESSAVAFVGLVAATVAAGSLSVCQRSLTIAVLGLAGALMVPMIVHVNRLDAYLLVVALGACVVAHLRQWTTYAFAAIVAAFAIVQFSWPGDEWIAKWIFHSTLYLLTLAVTLGGARSRSRAANNLCWTFVASAAIVWATTMKRLYFQTMESASVGACLAIMAYVHAGPHVACFVISAIMSFTLLTFESAWLGKWFLPALGGGTVTIAWAAVACGLLAVGIICRLQLSRVFGLLYLAGAVVKLLVFDTSLLTVTSRFVVFCAVGLTMLGIAFLYLRYKSRFQE